MMRNGSVLVTQVHAKPLSCKYNQRLGSSRCVLAFCSVTMEAVIPGEHWLDIGGGDRLIQLFSVEMMFAECALTFSLTESASFCKLLDLFSSLTLQSSG